MPKSALTFVRVARVANGAPLRAYMPFQKRAYMFLHALPKRVNACIKRWSETAFPLTVLSRRLVVVLRVAAQRARVAVRLAAPVRFALVRLLVAVG